MNSKAISIVSYLGIIGWLIAYFGGKGKTDELSRYHLKQGLGLAITGIVLGIVINILSGIIPTLGVAVSGILSLVIVILLIMGIINAANDAKKPLPIIGKSFEGMFGFIDKES